MITDDMISTPTQSPIFAGRFIMETTTLIYLGLGTLAFAFLLGWYLRVQGRKELEAARQAAQTEAAIQEAKPKPFGSSQPEIRRLQLQAYERCIILCERLAFSSLFDRSNYKAVSAAQLKQELTQLIKQEYEYNLSQQLYVSPAAWDGLSKLKEQQIFIIHQISAMLPDQATGNDLAAKIMELLSHDENATLQPIVANLLRTEARQLML
jgi:hypothetical protein